MVAERPVREPVHVYNEAIAALNGGDWTRAQVLAGEVSRLVTGHGGVHFIAGVAALELRQMQPAIEHLQKACQLAPRRADYLAQLARGLAMARFFREARAAADAALALSPADPVTLGALAVVYTQVNAHEKAIGLFRRVVELVPGHASHRFNLATSLTATGDLVAAGAELDACLRLEPRYWKAHLALAQLRGQTPSSNHVQRLQELLHAHGDDPAARLYVNLALAKELEDLGEYGRSFDHLAAGKRSHGTTLGYSPVRSREIFEAIASSVPEPLQGGEGEPTSEPIFVVGMPRSGTTLVERILSSHPQVQSCGELQNFSVELKRASGSRTRDMLDLDTVRRATGLDWAALGRAYLQSTRPATGQRPRFVDKLPHNFLYAGFIARALPNARIVCLRRDPLDTCLGNFRQLFALSSPYYDYSYDLLDTGRYYVEFDRLMRHWERVLPGRILQIDYESLVDNQEGASKQLLEFCGLPWDAACLRFEDNAAPVATASAVQVRSGMSRDYVQRWRRYGERLDPLRALLADAGIALPE